LACVPREGCGRRGVARPDSEQSPARARGEGSDGRGPPVGHREGEEAKRASAGTGPRGLRWAGGEEKNERAGAKFWAAGKEKEKGKDGPGWAENVLGGRKGFGNFLSRNQHIQLKFEIKEFKFN
jgi:hypothetical protein